MKRLQSFHKFSIIFWVLESSIQIATSTLRNFSLEIMTQASSTVSQSQCLNLIRCCRAKEYLLVVIEDGMCQLIEEYSSKHHIFQDGFLKKWNLSNHQNLLRMMRWNFRRYLTQIRWMALQRLQKLRCHSLLSRISKREQASAMTHSQRAKINRDSSSNLLVCHGRVLFQGTPKVQAKAKEVTWSFHQLDQRHCVTQITRWNTIQWVILFLMLLS